MGTVYLASVYGMKCDDANDDTPALNNLFTTIANATSPATGATIVLPATGHWCKLSTAAITWPANVNLQGCGMYGSLLKRTPTLPPCGLDLQFHDTTAKIRLLDYGQVTFRDLAIVDNNTGDCTGGDSPLFLITNTVTHFENVSIKGAVSHTNTTWPCNDALTFGSNVGACTGMGTSDCFGGYGSTFHNIYFANTRRMGIFNSAANGIDLDNLIGDSTNGNACPIVNGGGMCGSSPAGSAFEFNATAAPAVDYPYSNVFTDIDIEQGDPNIHTQDYKYALDIYSNAGPNYVFGITCSDPQGASACVHIGSNLVGVNVQSQMVLGCYLFYNSFPGCVLRDSIGNYKDLVVDPSTMSIFGQTYYGSSLGMPGQPFNYLRLAVGIDSPSNITGVPNVDALGGIVGFSGTTAGSFNPGHEYQLFSDGVNGASQFTVLPFETWLGQFILNTNNGNGTQPIQMQPIYSYGSTGTQLSPTVFSIPAGAASGSYVTNAPPLYVSAENQVSFQGVNPHPANGTAFATVQGFTASVLGSAGGAPRTVLGTYYNGTVPPSPATYYTSFSQQMAWTNSANESHAYVVMPFNYTAKGLCVITSTAQGGTNSLTVTLRQNGVSAPPQATVLAGGGAGTWCDDAGTLTGSLGDRLDLMLHNNDPATSATIVSITLGVTPTLPATGMLVFGLGAQTLTTVANNYFAPFGGSTATTNLANAQVALPRAVTLRNLHCYVNTCPPAGATANIEVFQNGSLPTGGLFIQVLGTGCTPGDKSDTSRTEQFMPGDTIELWEQQLSGITSIGISSCSVEHD